MDLVLRSVEEIEVAKLPYEASLVQTHCQRSRERVE